MTQPSVEQHREAAEQIVARCAVITLSDTRNETTDTSGRYLLDQLKQQGHEVAAYAILPDEPDVLMERLKLLLTTPTVDVVFTNGGTGISRRDSTIEVVERLLNRPLPGFGELFRMLSWEQVGSAAMLSRAVGGVSGDKLIFALPGSRKAVELALEKLILPEIKHLIYELRK